MRSLAAIALAAAALAGCGIGAGEERPGGGAELRVTRGFGTELLRSDGPDPVREDETVMRFLQARAKVRTRYGGGFVQAIDGLAGNGTTGGTEDWFYFVNGVLAGNGSAERELELGDVIQWDFRDWRATQDVRAIVGAFPEPFLNGLEGKRLPVRVECEHSAGRACKGVKEKLRELGTNATGAALGAPGTSNVIRVVVATFARARELPSVRAIELGPGRSGVFARFTRSGRGLDLLGPDGKRVREAGAGAGLVAALRPADDELLWLVGGTDAAGVDAAAAALDRRRLRDAFAVAIEGAETVKLPLAGEGG